MLDVAVIGGGPIGSRVAFKLAVSGYRVTVFERRSNIGEKLCCTGIISQECISNFNISRDVILRKFSSAKLFSPSGEFIRIARPEIEACVIDRPVFDRAMAGQAQRHGAEFQLNSDVKEIIAEAEGIRIDVNRKGRVQQVRARSAVLTTGFNAPLVKQLGFSKPADSVAGAQADVQNNGIEEIEVHFNQTLAPGFFAWLVPTSEGRCLAGLISRDSPGKRLRDWLNNLETQGKITIQNSVTRYGGIPMRPLPRTFADRMLVVGDAAGQVKPTTGGGIYFGMLCADMAADTMHMAIQKEDLSSERLSVYERNWKKRIGSELRGEYLARKLYERLSDKQIESLLARAKSTGVIDSLLKDDISFDWHGGLVLKVLKAGLLSQASRFLRLPDRKG